MQRRFLATACAATAVLTSCPAWATNDVSAAPKPPKMVRWSDPSENAFIVNVPRDWQIVGGTHRNSQIDARNYVWAKSPDGKITAWVDAPNILPRQVPHPAYYQLGYFDGRVVQSPAGPLKIERFRTGSQYASDFAAKLCANPKRLSAFDLTGQSGRINASIAPMAAQVGARVEASAGDFTFRCGNRSGFTYAVTVLAYTTAGGPHNWAVYKLAGYLADRAHINTARYVMNAMISSFALDSAWEMAYERQINDTTGQLRAISNRIAQASIQQARQSLEENVAMVQKHQQQFDASSKASMSSYQRQQASLDRIAQKRSDATLGQIHGCDDTGHCATVSNEYQYHWTDRSGNVVPGPSDGSPPGPQYHPFTPDY